MLSHFEQRQLPYTPQQMFDLVAGVDQYSEFAPWCVASRINHWESETIFTADLVVGYTVFRERFSSRVILDPHKELYIAYLKGPLKKLKNKWVFKDDGQGGCVIDFSVDFEFQNGALQALATMFFNEVVKRMVDAFEKRAESLYSPFQQ